MSPDAGGQSSLSMARWNFLRAFIRDRNMVGSVTPTSRRVARRMAQLGGVEQASLVAELGSGTGAITRELLAMMPASSRLWAFELHPLFVQHLGKTVTDPRFILVAESAEMVARVDTGAIEAGFDAIISSIPFRLLSPDLTHRILDDAAKALRPGAPFVTIQYHPSYLLPYIREHFAEVTRHPSVWNIPPVTLFRARNVPAAR